MKQKERIGDKKVGEKLYCSYVELKGDKPFEVEIINISSIFSSNDCIQMDIKRISNNRELKCSLLDVELYQSHSIVKTNHVFGDMVIGISPQEVYKGCIDYSLRKQRDWNEYEKLITNLLEK